MLSVERIVIAGLVASCALASSTAAEELRYVVTANELRAVLPDQTVAWRVTLNDGAADRVLSHDRQAVLLSNGWLIDMNGRVLSRPVLPADLAAVRGAELDAPTAAWDTPTEITPPPPAQTSDAHQPPMFDRGGDAWVINTHIESGTYYLQVRRSLGHSGTWGPMETISSTTRYVAGPEGVMDINDNIMIVFRDIASGYHLYAIRYEPGSGWGPLQHVYSTSSFFQAIEVGADRAGNVAAVFDPELSGSGSVWSVVYQAAGGTWGAARQISPVGYRTILPTVFCNPTADAMYLVYLVRSGGPVGLYAHAWDSNARDWGPPVFLPGSETASFSGAGPASRYPGVVDASGTVTFFWGTPYVPYASRCEAGVWQPAVQLMPLEIVDVENFAGAAVSVRGDVFGAFSRFESGTVRFFMFKFEPGAGWLAPQNPYTAPLNLATRTRVSFYQGPRAVATMLGVQGGTRQITSILYDEDAWATSLLDIPGQEDAFYADLASDRGEVLVVYEGEINTVNQGIKATFLRDPHVGDMNCDGEVSFGDINPFVLYLADFSQWQSTYPDCDPRNGDINGDGVYPSFQDINPFVALLLGG
jgi:hypothetical protein